LKAAVESAGVLGTRWRGMWFGEKGGERFLDEDEKSNRRAKSL
jgi:hypothetical protein